MSDAPIPKRPPRPVPPRIDESGVIQALKDLFASWRQSLKEEFRGLTATGVVVPDLFPLRAAGVSTKPLMDAAGAFLGRLDARQRAAASFPVDSEVWRHWSNIHRNLMRHGVCLAELSELQRAAVYTLLRVALGAQAYAATRSVMKLNETLAEMTGLPLEFGEYFYWISIFGTPSSDKPWGWQIDGHHCNINCFVLGDQMVLSPMLLGSEPILAEDGIYKGLTVLREEEAEGWAFMNKLTPDQRAKATIGYDLPFDGYASGFKDNVVIPYDGLPASDMAPAQRERLIDLIGLYVGRLPSGHVQLRLNEVQQHLDNTFFAWIGNFDSVSPFYYRIYNPVIFIEFYHQPGVALPNTGYNRRHAHALVRTPNGNDYGRAMLELYRRSAAARAHIRGITLDRE